MGEYLEEGLLDCGIQGKGIEVQENSQGKGKEGLIMLYLQDKVRRLRKQLHGTVI